MGSTEEHKPISGNLPVFLKTICAFTALIFAAAPEQHRDFRISVLSVANYDWSSYIASRLVFARSRSPAALVCHLSLVVRAPRSQVVVWPVFWYNSFEEG